MMKEKLRRLEKDLDEFRDEQKYFVTMKHFDAVVEPIKVGVLSIQKDIREILRAVADSRKHS